MLSSFSFHQSAISTWLDGPHMVRSVRGQRSDCQLPEPSVRARCSGTNVLLLRVPLRRPPSSCCLECSSQSACRRGERAEPLPQVPVHHTQLFLLRLTGEYIFGEGFGASATRPRRSPAGIRELRSSSSPRSDVEHTLDWVHSSHIFFAA